MAEYGIVKKTSGNTADVALTRSEACKHCNACIPSLTDKTMILKAQNDAGAKEGDYVSVSVSQSGFLSAVFILYGIPCLFFLTVVCVLAILGVTDWICVLSGAVGLALSYLLIKRFQKRLNMALYLPHIDRVLDKPSGEDPAEN